METLSFYVNNKIYKVLLEYTKNKNIYLKIKKNNIVVSVPFLTSKKIIQKFVEKHIQKFVNHLEKNKKNNLYSLKDNFIILRNKKYKIITLTGFIKIKVKILNNNIYLETKDGIQKEKDFLIKKLLKQITFEYILKKIKYFQILMKMHEHKFIVSFKKSAWGTNLVNKNKISFSSRLSHFEEEITDYLIVHELSHSKFPNHSKDFWDNVKKFKSNYKELSNKLQNI